MDKLHPNGNYTRQTERPRQLFTQPFKILHLEGLGRNPKGRGKTYYDWELTKTNAYAWSRTRMGGWA